MKKITTLMINLAKKNGNTEGVYKRLVNEKIRAKYSINDELAILRQRATKPDEFAEYNAFVETVKAEAKAQIENPEGETFTVDKVLAKDIESEAIKE